MFNFKVFVVIFLRSSRPWPRLMLVGCHLSSNVSRLSSNVILCLGLPNFIVIDPHTLNFFNMFQVFFKFPTESLNLDPKFMFKVSMAGTF